MRKALPLLLAAALTPACTLGLDHSGDETGLRREFLDVPGHPDRRLSYLIDPSPSDPRVVFVHGSPGHSSMYADYLRRPVPGTETIAVDRLGYGESRPHEAIVSFAEQAAAIEPLLERRAGLWPIVVGHSLGGPIAARLAADNPDRVGALVLVAGGLNPDLEELRWYNAVARWPIVNPFLAEFLQISNEEMRACRAQVEELDPLLDAIRCPVVILHGTDDDLVPFEAVEHSIERFADNPHVYVTVLVGEGHRVTKERKEEVWETVDELRRGLVDLVEEGE